MNNPKGFCEKLRLEFEILKEDYGKIWLVVIGLGGWFLTQLYRGNYHSVAFWGGVVLFLLSVGVWFFVRINLLRLADKLKNCGGEK